MKDLGLLALRLTTGGLLAGHGLQKLAGAFGGPGMKGTAGFMESLGLKPGSAWGLAAGLAETSGGLMALGLLEPLGEIGVISAMAMATGTVHRGKPIWSMAGGAELPVTNAAVAAALLATGPGRISVDNLLDIRLPRSLAALAMLGAAAAVVYGITQREQPQAPAAQPPQQEPQAGGEHQPQAEADRDGTRAAETARR